jgi:hypothetical protein
MADPQKDTDRDRRVQEAAEAQEREGHGTVPNVTPGAPNEEMVGALHKLEEEKGDWSKDR